MAKSIGIGIVGTRFAGQFHTDMWRRIPGAEIVAASAPSEASRNAYNEAYGPVQMYETYAELLADPKVDVVDLCVPNYLHADFSIQAMEAGKDVICEKPFATTVEDGERVVEAQKRTGKRYFYAEDWIFAPTLKRVEQIIDEGGIGTPYYYKGKECHNGSHSPYAKTIEHCGGGAMMHIGIHPIGYFYHLLGMPERVTGCCNGGLTDNFVHHDFEGEDWSVAVLHYANGVKALIEGNYITTGGMDDVIEVYGSEGLVKAELTFGSPLSVFSKKGISYAVEKAELTTGWTKPAVDEAEALGYKDELEHFLRVIQGKEEQIPSTTAEAGLDVLKIVDAIYRSHKEGCTITL